MVRHFQRHRSHAFLPQAAGHGPEPRQGHGPAHAGTVGDMILVDQGIAANDAEAHVWFVDIVVGDQMRIEQGGPGRTNAKERRVTAGSIKTVDLGSFSNDAGGDVFLSGDNCNFTGIYLCIVHSSPEIESSWFFGGSGGGALVGLAAVII